MDHFERLVGFDKLNGQICRGARVGLKEMPFPSPLRPGMTIPDIGYGYGRAWAQGVMKGP